ncbi:hypothetical protein BU25DRAFT_463672 [Macroventuria anomochaeta]|uniref:Uncharacterized protein n=1 Tax=Macroventuria anomochaeta TaxID=301207 RepID=A0ACB6RKF0_9PLEO|nr:uncharacterized protein BU25DRAFT_463672 [Macroventuria anomochaeta]KAF2621444.1 hypothetical protein BU25DRAFT_463672 [Macroventuria anomochaeta]
MLAQTAVATNPVPTQAPATVHSPTPPALSNATSALQVSTRQSSVATTPVANTASIPTTILPAPAYIPATCFNQAVPAPFAP